MDTCYTYFKAKAFELPKKRVTCYFSRFCHAGAHNGRLLSEELIPQELLRHPDYASLLQEGGFLLTLSWYATMSSSSRKGCVSAGKLFIRRLTY